MICTASGINTLNRSGVNSFRGAGVCHKYRCTNARKLLAWRSGTSRGSHSHEACRPSATGIEMESSDQEAILVFTAKSSDQEVLEIVSNQAA